MNCIEKQMLHQRMILGFSTLIFIAFIALFLFLKCKDELHWRELQRWEKVPATVVSYRKVPSDGKNKESYSEIIYKCQVGKKTYFGHDSGPGGKKLLPRKFHRQGAAVYCFFNRATGKTILAYRKNDTVPFLFGLLFFGGFAVFSIVQMKKLKQFDTRTVPPEFAERLSPPPELPKRFTVSRHLLYAAAEKDPAVPGVFLHPEENNIIRGTGAVFFGGVFIVFLLAGYLCSNWGVTALSLLQLIPFYFCLKRGKGFVLNTSSRSFYFSSKTDKAFPPEKAIPFSDLQAIFLVCMNDRMGLLLLTSRGNIVIGCKNPQQLMCDAVQLADLTSPQLPIYDLAHREYDKKERQCYIA